MVIGLHLQIPHGLQAYHTEYPMSIPDPCVVWQDSLKARTVGGIHLGG